MHYCPPQSNFRGMSPMSPAGFTPMSIHAYRMPSCFNSLFRIILVAVRRFKNAVAREFSFGIISQFFSSFQTA